jgi:hypothetical protein
MVTAGELVPLERDILACDTELKRILRQKQERFQKDKGERQMDRSSDERDKSLLRALEHALSSGGSGTSTLIGEPATHIRSRRSTARMPGE